MRILSVVLLGLLATASPAADHPMAAYVNADTMAVLYVDVGKFDIDAVADYVKKLGVPTPPDMEKQHKHVKTVTDGLKSAGVTGMGISVDMASMQGKYPAAALFLAKGTDPKAASDKIKKLEGFGDLSIEPAGNSLILGTPDSVSALKEFKAAPRSELVGAMKAVGSDSIALVLMPPQESRKLVEGMVPNLPPQLGGGSSKALTQDMLWAMISVDCSKGISPRVVIQAKDAASAKAINDIAANGLKFVGTMKDPEAEAAKSITDTVVLNVKDDQVHIGVDSKKIEAGAGKTVNRLREAADRSRSMNNLKQMALAMHNYHDSNGQFPADICDKDGKPILSYRVLLLPYLEQETLYKQFKLDEPWDSENNKKLTAQMPKVYRSPFQKNAEGTTVYLGGSGKDYLFSPEAKGKGRRLQDITDGTSNTVMFVEASDDAAVQWTKPGDWKPDAKDPKKGLVRAGREGVIVAFCDGSVRMLKSNTDPKNLLAYLTVAGGEIVNDD